MTCKNHCKDHVLTTILDYAIGDLTKHRALARKLKVMAFSRNWEIRQAYTKDRRYGWQQGIFFFLLQPVERYKMPSWEINISKHDITQNKQITNQK